jgi:hypothetical protein
MQAQGSQQVSLRTSRPTPGSAGSARGFAGVAQLVEHLFCKQVVSGSIPLASSGARRAKTQQNSHIAKASEGCPSGQREQAVNLPARAYVGSNPTPSTPSLHSVSGGGVGLFVLGSSAPPRGSTRFVIPEAGEFRGAPPQVLGPRPQNSRRVSLTRRGLDGPTENGSRPRGMLPAACGLDTTLDSAGVTQLVESQFSKLKVDGSSPFSRSIFSASRFLTRSASIRKATSRSLKPIRPASLVAGEASASIGAQRTPVREHRSGAEAHPPAKIAGRPHNRINATTRNAHLAQMVEHVLGKDEVTSSILVVGSNSVQLQ